MKDVPINDWLVGEGQPLTVMCGPCVIESEGQCLEAAETLKGIFEKAGIRLIFKSSYDKANRSAYYSFRGPGVEEGLRILERVKREWGLPVVSDVHTVEEAVQAGEVLDLLQIPAFLCRQTDLLYAAAKTGKVVSVKKGQFLAPWDMANVVKKIESAGNEKIILIERGATFGYNNLVCDMRSIPIMQQLGYPVCFDATHAVQLPGGQGDATGGQREFIPVLAKAAIAAGANCLFMEAHPDPKNAKSDAGSVLDFKDLPRLLGQLKRLYELIQTEECACSEAL
jgi:2-dehydro-3-deoxyphosphooctonate aldolase (KDO 8-P synthase)